MRSKLLILLVLMMSLSIGCTQAIDWKKASAAGYDVTGVVGTQIKETVAPMCTDKKIPAVKCDKMLDIYNKLRTAYRTSGQALITAMRATDAVSQQQSIEAYKKAINEVTILLPQLITLAKELGVDIGGIK